LQLSPAQAPYAESIYWVYGVVLDDAVGCDATAMMQRLAARGVGTRPFFWPLHEQPVFLRRGWYAGERYPVAERLARRGFYLPSGLALTDEQIVRAAAALRDAVSK
jgi:perosamine synthetase